MLRLWKINLQERHNLAYNKKIVKKFKRSRFSFNKENKT